MDRDQRIKIEECLKESGHAIEAGTLDGEEERKIESGSLISESGFGFTDIGV
jgi:hypothetical protein